MFISQWLEKRPNAAVEHNIIALVVIFRLFQ